MKKIRIGNDFKFIWAINWNGLPEDFSDATDIKLTAIVYNNKVELTLGEDFEISGNLVKVDFSPDILTCTGVYNVELKYIKPTDGFIDGERRSAVDVNAFQIVGSSEEADTEGDVATTSEILTGLEGASAFEVWLRDNPDSTKEDYFNWLREPATDIVEDIQDKIVEVDEAITNTVIAISNSETATLNANTAALNADNARLAIQDDLALKANQADLVQLESDVKVLSQVKMRNLIVNGDFLDGTTGWYSDIVELFEVVNGVAVFKQGAAPVWGGGITNRSVGQRLDISFPSWIYVGVKAKSTMLPSGIRISMGTDVGSVIIGSMYGTVPLTDSFAYYSGSAIISSGERIPFKMGSYANGKFEVDSIFAINLTETFGAGNEPTEEEMDLLLDIAGISYINGEVIIPAQKIMQWQLALIRKNKNAIIALGGTII